VASVDLILLFHAGSAELTRVLDKLVRPHVVFPVPSPATTNPFGVPSIAEWTSALASYGSFQGFLARTKPPPGVTLGRVAAIGYSKGCTPLRLLLDFPDASKLDFALFGDGIHWLYNGQAQGAPPPPVRAVSPLPFKKIISMAKRAIARECVLAITHSSVRPALASTTETANVIWAAATAGAVEGGGGIGPVLAMDSLAEVRWPSAEYPAGSKLPDGVITGSGYCTVRPSVKETNFMPPETFCWSGFADGWSVRRNLGDFYVFGWAHETKSRLRDPSGNRDHAFQAAMVIPQVVDTLLVRRWNPACESDPIPVGGAPAAKCTFGSGTAYGEGPPPAPLPDPYPFDFALPYVSPECPTPPPGAVVLGRPGDPCWYGQDDAPERRAQGAFVGVLVGVTGLALGYIAWRAVGAARAAEVMT